MKTFKEYLEASGDQIKNFKAQVINLADKGENDNEIANFDDSSMRDLDQLYDALDETIKAGKEEGENFQVIFSFNYQGSLFEGTCITKKKKIGDLTLQRDKDDQEIKWSKSDSANDFPDKIVEFLSGKNEETEETPEIEAEVAEPKLEE